MWPTNSAVFIGPLTENGRLSPDLGDNLLVPYVIPTE